MWLSAHIYPSGHAAWPKSGLAKGLLLIGVNASGWFRGFDFIWHEDRVAQDPLPRFQCVLARVGRRFLAAVPSLCWFCSSEWPGAMSWTWRHPRARIIIWRLLSSDGKKKATEWLRFELPFANRNAS